MNNFIYLKNAENLYILKDGIYVVFYSYKENRISKIQGTDVPDLVMNAISKCKLKQGEVYTEKGLKIKNVFMVGNQKY